MCRDPRLLDRVAALLGAELDCFGSQFIFKQPGALGQPWHQDAWYFPFDRGPQVGAWLAVTPAVLDNGPLHVLPGSHGDPVHDVVPDRRGYAELGYVEIVDRDTSGAAALLMDPGDLLVFHSHLMHCSTDNTSRRLRAAMVYHYAAAGTEDRFAEKFGHPSPVHDWVSVRRAARAQLPGPGGARLRSPSAHCAAASPPCLAGARLRSPSAHCAAASPPCPSSAVSRLRSERVSTR